MNRFQKPPRRSMVLGLLTASLCSGQLVQFRGPDSGLVYDPPTQSIRSIAGLIGAARMGDAVLEGIEWASVAPNGKVALYRKGGRIAALTAAGPVQEVPTFQGEAPEDVFWSAESQSAVLVWTRDRRTQRIEVDASGAITAGAAQAFELDGEITAVAGTSSGPLFAAVAGRGIYAVEARSGVSRLLLPLETCRALAASADGTRIWAIDGARGILFRIGMADEQPAVVATDAERLAGVSRLAMSSNESDLLLANAETRKLYLFDGGNQELTEVAALEAPVTQMRPLGRKTLYLLSHRATATESVQLYDALRGDIFFVPFVGVEQ